MSVGQTVSNNDPNFASSGTTIAVNLTVTAGSTIVVWGSHDSAGTIGTIACSDNVNGSYGAAIDDINDATDNSRIASFRFTNTAGGAITVTITLGTAHVAKFVIVQEDTGAATSSSLDGHNATAGRTTPGTGTDALTTGAMTGTFRRGNTIQAIGVNLGSGGAPTQGTGFTSDGALITFGGATVAFVRAEHRTTSNGFPQAATFTMPSASAGQAIGVTVDDSGALAAPFDESSPDHIPTTQISVPTS